MQKSIIRNIGSYLTCDDNGYLIDDNEKNQLQSKWMTPVYKLVNLIILKTANDLVSIYLRGSVARGTAIDNISDIDIFVITSTDISSVIRDQIYKLGNRINEAYPYVTRVDIAFYNRNFILVAKEKVLIKYRSILLYGENLSINIPLLKPGLDTSLTLSNLANDLDKIRVSKFHDDEDIRLSCRWLAKKIVRSGLEIVAKNELVYTRDLYKCWESFSKHFPGHKNKMYQVLNLAINPSSNIIDLYKIENYGRTVLKLWKS